VVRDGRADGAPPLGFFISAVLCKPMPFFAGHLRAIWIRRPLRNNSTWTM